MKKLIGLILLSLFIVGCSSNQDIKLPEGIPSFVDKSDFEKIDWEQKAVPFGNSGITGNENKSGVIGAEMPSLTTQKWMWHLWGTDEAMLTIVGFHKESGMVHPIMTTGWSTVLAGPNNGADRHMPSSVQIPEKGEWAFLLYTGETLFDILVFDIKE